LAALLGQPVLPALKVGPQLAGLVLTARRSASASALAFAIFSAASSARPTIFAASDRRPS
jgi:hypothetical protein